MSGLTINDKAAEFVFDWKKRTDKQQKKHIVITIVSFIVVFAVCMAAFFWFQNSNYERIVNQNMNYIQDSTVQETNQLEKEMKNTTMQVSNFAEQYSILSDVYSDADIKEKLKLIDDKNLFDRIAYVSPDGLDTSLEGLADVSDRQYFKNAMNGKSGWEAIEKSRVTGNPTVVFYAPIVSNDKIMGAMIGFYEQNRLDNLFSYKMFNYTPNTYLMVGSGMVVANSKDELITENMLEKLSQKSFTGDVDFEKIMESIEDKNRTAITFSFVENHNTNVGTIVQFEESDWMVMSVLPHDVTGEMVSNANSIGTSLLISLACVFLLLMVVMIISFNRQKVQLENEISLASENLEITLKDERKQLLIIESLVDIYSSVYYIDIINVKYRRIKESSEVAQSIPDNGYLDRGFSDYIKKFVADSDKAVMTEFLDFNTFPERFENENVLSAEYRRIGRGWCRATVVPTEYGNDGKPISLVFAVQLIEQEKTKELKAKEALQMAYEAAQVASKAKTTFLSSMSHDIRTPMNAIIGMTAIAGANLDNTEKVSDCLKKITSSSKHLLGLINEVLDMSKIESGKVDLVEEEFCLSDTIDNLISINQPLIDEKHHTLIVKVNDVKHENVIGDSTRLQQVFTNLLSNAIKYTPENGRIEISISEKETNKTKIGWYEVVFKDNGIGMTEEFQRNLFDPFTRADDERIANIQGTGLGMPIARNIVRMMNGDITVESKINEGSIFSVSFALKLQTDEDFDSSCFVDLPVLVVDDDEIACESTCNILDSLEMNSEWVTTGMEAVEKTIAHHEDNNDYYAVIIDWKMPQMDGVQTTREIRKRVGDDVPIIVLTAYDWTEIEQEARAAGANAFLSKPLFKSRIARLFNELAGNENKAPEKNLNDLVENQDFSGKRVLLVEDNELNREITIELMSMLGLETEIAENGKIGVEKFSQSEQGYYDLVFMDIQMPVMNGYDATAAIRASQHPDAKTVPIVAMTANAFASDVRAAFNVGMNGHIAKPIDIKQILKVLNEHLGD